MSEEDAERSAAASFVDDHVRVFNAAVQSGVWDAFVDLFTSDAVLEFVGPAVGPFVGRAAISEAYAQRPPDDTIVLAGPPRTDGDELIAPYAWMATGATGTMRFTQRDRRIARLVVTFD